MHPQRIQDKRKRNGKKGYESCQQRFDYKQQDPRDASDMLKQNLNRKMSDGIQHSIFVVAIEK